MSDQFLAEIRIFPYTFAPKGWAFCNGQLLPISQNTALFSLLGTAYGGDGKSTFALPNLMGAAPLHTGGNQPGSGLSVYFLGQQGGSQTVSLIQSEIPAHNHGLNAANNFGTGADPTDGVFSRGRYGTGSGGSVAMYIAAAPDAAMDPRALAVAGGSQPHNNMQPYLGFNFCIALQGIYPPRQ